jgi:hypothetical protein
VVPCATKKGRSWTDNTAAGGFSHWGREFNAIGPHIIAKPPKPSYPNADRLLLLTMNNRVVV